MESTLTKRLIACFDIKDGLVTKASKFQNNIKVGDPIELAQKLYAQGVDEIIFYDIMASHRKCGIDIDIVKRVAKQIFIPFTVGGGIKTLDDMYRVLDAGAEKISIDSMAVRNPNLIQEGAAAFGSQCIVLSMQVKKRDDVKKFPSGYEIAIDGARTFTGMDALEWAKKGEQLGAGEICVNSIDNDGTHGGYDIDITQKIANTVTIPVIASGGAGNSEHVAEVFTNTSSSAAIISSLLYSPRIENVSIETIKTYLIEKGIAVRV